MNKTVINPWQWQDRLGNARAMENPHASPTLFCAGQAALNANGQPIKGKKAEPFGLCFDNQTTIRHYAGHSLKKVVRLSHYQISVEQIFAVYSEVISRLQAASSLLCSTLIEVKTRAFQQSRVETDTIAVK
ncbi:Rid family hydrolase [Spirosoma radiotolerans]|uniref:Uncharacterized protein n=1 Tax=Spirosoma radiotolerans TaxID=1379870 RepID=A0A0E3VAA7_9BACT|nr:Rid family hydrolase [Spirosoma radiotolerans]AKD57906.1 hypothetical protein SD10_26400 [Spirosoma radiotolerans]